MIKKATLRLGRTTTVHPSLSEIFWLSLSKPFLNLFKLKNFGLWILTVGIFLSLFSSVSAQTTSAYSTQSAILNQQQANAYLQPPSVNLSPQSPLYANLIAVNLMHTASCILTGVSPVYPCMELLQTKDTQGNIQTVPVLSQGLSGGVFGVVNRINLAMFTTRPVGTIEYIAEVKKGFGIIPEAHAQNAAIGGGGNGVLSPITNLWQVSRNIAYLVMIIVFVLIGLMVMFRRRLNPQTVITVQMALPGLVIGLIMITFSYFFAALLTDFAFIGTDLVGFYYRLAQPPPPPGQPISPTFSQPLAQTLTSENVMSVFSRYVGVFDQQTLSEGVGTVFNNIGQFPQTLLRILVSGMAYQIGNTIGGPLIGAAGAGICGTVGLAGVGIGGLAGVLGCGTVGNVAGGLIGGGAAAVFAWNAPVEALTVAVWIILIILVIYSMFRLLFQLIKNYISIIFLTITAPFYFLVASMPGKSDIAFNWLRNMLCNVLAFPAVIAVLYFVAYLLGANRNEFEQIFYVSTNQSVAGQNTLPLFGRFNVIFLRTILAVGALLAVPSIPDIICRAIGKVGPYGGMIEKEIGEARRGQGYLNRGLSGAGRPFKDATTGFGSVFGNPRSKNSPWTAARKRLGF